MQWSLFENISLIELQVSLQKSVITLHFEETYLSDFNWIQSAEEGPS
jgi:hypothetical protein